MARLAVDPQYRRRGLAALLVKQVEQKLRALGAVRISAHVLKANAGGRGFWSSAKYGQDRHALRFIKDLKKNS